MRELIELFWYNYGMSKEFVIALKKSYPKVDIEELLRKHNYEFRSSIDCWIKKGYDDRGTKLKDGE